MEEQKELKFPLEWDACPNCGSTVAVGKSVVEEQKAKGKMPKDSQGGMLSLNTIVADPRTKALMVPLLIAQIDICATCGTLYCRRVDRKDAMVGALGLGQAGGPLPPSLLRPPSLS